MISVTVVSTLAASCGRGVRMGGGLGVRVLAFAAAFAAAARPPFCWLPKNSRGESWLVVIISPIRFFGMVRGRGLLDAEAILWLACTTNCLRT